MAKAEEDAKFDGLFVLGTNADLSPLAMLCYKQLRRVEPVRHAATIHKSQGSEYPAVIIPAMTQHYPMLQRNLLYTGVTRGKWLVVLVGQKKAIAIAVRNVSGRRRWSKLDEWLRLGASRTSFDASKAGRSRH